MVPELNPKARLRSHQLRNFVALQLQPVAFYLQENLPAKIEDLHGSRSDPIYATKVYDSLYQKLWRSPKNYIQLKSAI